MVGSVPSPTFSSPLRLGIDIGGTFTDLVLIDAAGRVATRKAPSTPDDYSRAILEAAAALLAELGLEPGGVREIVHGTTVATNAILERQGARTGLITTRGFRDSLEIGRLRYPRLYDWTWIKPPPLVERRWRLEVVERLDPRGEVIVPLDEESVRQAIGRLLSEGINALAVSLLHSYADPAHEQRVGQIAADLAPELPVTLSSSVLPEVGEYERTSTTVINAYLQPVVGRYLANLEDGLRGCGLRAPVLVMQSNGGVMSARAASAYPMHIVESGPAAGVIAAQEVARRLDLPNVLTLDMGGTTAKASIVEQGQLHQAAQYEVGAGLNVEQRLNRGAGYVLRVPAVDIAEVGAGGGSLVWLDPAGALHVGPRSAGSVPGPVCYRAGGEEPTLTDANLLLGYLHPEALLGGALPIDRAYAREVFEAKVARPLGLETLEAAFGVHRIGVANMVRVVKAVSSERGRDPRAFALIAFGGNGPVHAALVARELGLRRVVVPPAPGLFSAFGLLSADLAHHFSRSIIRQTDELTLDELRQAFAGLEAQALAALAAEGHGAEAVQVSRSLDLRYAGQSFELRLSLGDRPIDAELLAELPSLFGAEHERTYGHQAPGDPVELVNLRLVAQAPGGRWSLAAAEVGPPGGPEATGPAERRRPAYFGPEQGLLETPLLTRQQVGSEPLAGPLIVEEYDATTIVPPGCTVQRDRYDNLVIEIDQPARGSASR